MQDVYAWIAHATAVGARRATIERTADGAGQPGWLVRIGIVSTSDAKRGTWMLACSGTGATPDEAGAKALESWKTGGPS